MKKLKRYIAKFKIWNGDATYSIVVTTEAENDADAKKYFKGYECESDMEIWKLQIFDVVKTFDELWEWL